MYFLIFFFVCSLQIIKNGQFHNAIVTDYSSFKSFGIKQLNVNKKYCGFCIIIIVINACVAHAKPMQLMVHNLITYQTMDLSICLFFLSFMINQKCQFCFDICSKQSMICRRNVWYGNFDVKQNHFSLWK